jgi:hypothetical protein
MDGKKDFYDRSINNINEIIELINNELTYKYQ